MRLKFSLTEGLVSSQLVNYFCREEWEGGELGGGGESEIASIGNGLSRWMGATINLMGGMCRVVNRGPLEHPGVGMDGCDETAFTG